MIESKNDFDAVLFQMIEGPSLSTKFSLEKLLKKTSTKAEAIAEFVQQNPEVKHLQSLKFEGLQVPDERHDLLMQLCPNIYRITLFACDTSRKDFQSIVKWIRTSERICSLSLPFFSGCWPQFVGLTQITELDIHDWKTTDSRSDYLNLINSMPKLTSLDCKPIYDLECLSLINNPLKIKSLSLSYAHDNYSRLILNRFSKLECLDLTKNQATALSDEILQDLDLPCIKALNLSSNDQLTDKGIISLKRFTHLTDLNLSFCKNIEDKALGIILQDLQLLSLSLNGCPKITERGLSHLASQVNLLGLSFGGNEEIHNISFVKLLSELKTLFIENSQLDEAPESLPMLIHLKKLVLLAICKAPHVNDVALATLSGMTHLVNFELSGSSITSQGEAIIKRLTTREVIWIG